MNIVESMKDILKNKTHLFTDFWKEDLKLVANEVGKDFYRMMVSGKNTFKSVKKNGLHFTWKDVKDGTADAALILKVLPIRIKDGFYYFKQDLAQEIETQPDQKHKTIFCLKVLGALTSFTLGTLYQFKRGSVEFNIKGIKKPNLLTQFLVAEIVFKLTYLFLMRLLNELEGHVTSPEEREHIIYFRQLLSRRSQPEDEEFIEKNDNAIQVVENLKIYIMTGERA